MLCKFVELNLNCVQNNVELYIVSYNGIIIKKENINSFNSKIYFNTKCENVKIIAKHKNQIIYKTLKLKNKKCQTFNADIIFNSIVSKQIFINIALLDNNYSFPIKKALLNFQSK